MAEGLVQVLGGLLHRTGESAGAIEATAREWIEAEPEAQLALNGLPEPVGVLLGRAAFWSTSQAGDGLWRAVVGWHEAQDPGAGVDWDRPDLEGNRPVHAAAHALGEGEPAAGYNLDRLLALGARATALDGRGLSTTQVLAKARTRVGSGQRRAVEGLSEKLHKAVMEGKTLKGLNAQQRLEYGLVKAAAREGKETTREEEVVARDRLETLGRDCEASGTAAGTAMDRLHRERTAITGWEVERDPVCVTHVVAYLNAPRTLEWMFAKGACPVVADGRGRRPWTRAGEGRRNRKGGADHEAVHHRVLQVIGEACAAQGWMTRRHAEIASRQGWGKGLEALGKDLPAVPGIPQEGRARRTAQR